MESPPDPVTLDATPATPRPPCPGYIGTEVAYSQGGYETHPGSSLVAPNVDRVLTDAIRRLFRD